jgi:polar amino acid transport system substrate-binding protein
MEGRTPMPLNRRFTTVTVALIAAVSLVAVACGDDDDDDDGSPTAGATTAASPAAGGEIDISGVPELEDDTLNVGSDIAYAPIEFLDETTNEPTGLDIDLANALAEALGVEAEFTNGAFDGLIPALDAERHDILMSAMSVNPERSEQVDFIEYFNAGTGILVAPGNPQGITTADDLCGKRVAVQEGTVQVDYLLGTEDAPGGLHQKCIDDGNDGIEVLRFGTNPEAVLALQAGQADAEIADYPVANYSADNSNEAVEIVADLQIDPANYGIAIRKTSTELRDVLQQAFDQIVEDGTYDEILEKWNLVAGKLE